MREWLPTLPALMPSVIDAVVDAFGRVFGLEMIDADRRGGRLPAQGDRMVAPTVR